MKATISDGREAMWNFIAVLETMPASDAASAVMEFVEDLSQGLDANRNTVETRHNTIRAIAERAAYLVGLEVIDESPAFNDNDYNDADMQDQALVWYGYGYEDGEEGMPPEPQARKEWDSCR